MSKTNDMGGPEWKGLDAKELAGKLEAGGIRCNCDLDSWEPTRRTGHSHVCRIHKSAIAVVTRPHDINRASIEGGIAEAMLAERAKRMECEREKLAGAGDE